MNKETEMIRELRDNLEMVAFLVSKGGAEREAHGKIVESLVILSQLEGSLKSKSDFSNDLMETNISKVSSPTVVRSKTDFTQEENEVDIEVEKVTRRLPRWFRNQSQYNSTILLNYLILSEQVQNVSVQALKNKCTSVKDFEGNYNQMKNFGEKNHGKVFEERDGHVTLWEPVKDYILKLYNDNRV
jgi:hypothetical protein